VICAASCSGELPVGVKPVVLGWLLGTITMTTAAAIPATTASAAAVTTTMNVRRFRGRLARRPCPRGPEGPSGPPGPPGSDGPHAPGRPSGSDGPQPPEPPDPPAGRAGSPPTAGKGAVEGSDAYHGPDDLLPLLLPLPPESLATCSTVLTAQIRGKYMRLREGQRPDRGTRAGGRGSETLGHHPSHPAQSSHRLGLRVGANRGEAGEHHEPVRQKKSLVAFANGKCFIQFTKNL
jgi:hypothetical protein